MKQCPECRLLYPSESAFCFVDGATLATLPDPRIGATLAGRYVIERELGVGGMATVYAARHLLVERPCAIKILGAQFAQDPVLRERFVREARHAQRISHPNVIEIFDQGETDDHTPFLVMELLEGRSLADVIAEGPLPLARALPIAVEMIRALGRAHDFEVIHRDLKPENVFLLAGDHVKLLDFGIARCAEDARLTNLGEIFGTPEYMAPERGNSIDAGPATDLYAFGIMLFEMVTGQLPFEAKDPAGWLMRHLKDTPPHLRQRAPHAPEALDRLIFDLMAKTPAERPADAHRVLAALVAISQSLGIPVPPEPEEEAAPLSTAPRSTGDPWRRRMDLFARMASRAFPAGSPPELAHTLDAIRDHLVEIEHLRMRAFEEQQRLESIEYEGREGRLRLGKAMDALTADASRSREEGRQLRARVTQLTEATKALIPEVKATHRDVVAWEGRSGFMEPYRELAAGYRRMAELVDGWWAARQRELVAEREAAEKERAIQDVNFQIRSLRDSLGNLERTTGERRQQSLQKIAEMGFRTQQLEGELIHLATRFCAPLRPLPALAPLFMELERVQG
ncbi:MAG: protein kinase [Minicystis sp.]